MRARAAARRSWSTSSSRAAWRTGCRRACSTAPATTNSSAGSFPAAALFRSAPPRGGTRYWASAAPADEPAVTPGDTEDPATPPIEKIAYLVALHALLVGDHRAG